MRHAKIPDRFAASRCGGDGRQRPFGRPFSVGFAVLAVLCVAASARPGRAADNAFGEYEVKAAFLLNFARLVEWPSAAFDGDQSPLVVGLLGNDPFDGALKAVVDGRRVGTRPIEVRQLSSLEEIRQCHIVFVSDPEPAPLPLILSAAQGRSVLLVGDSEEFAPRGGTISFYSDAGKVRFAINRHAAESAGLKISSRMLRLAKLVPEGTSTMPAPQYDRVDVGAAEPRPQTPAGSVDPL